MSTHNQPTTNNRFGPLVPDFEVPIQRQQLPCAYQGSVGKPLEKKKLVKKVPTKVPAKVPTKKVIKARSPPPFPRVIAIDVFAVVDAMTEQLRLAECNNNTPHPIKRNLKMLTSKPEPKPEPKSEPKPEPKSEPKSEPKPKPKSEPKPKPKSEPKPKPKPDNKRAAPVKPSIKFVKGSAWTQSPKFEATGEIVRLLRKLPKKPEQEPEPKQEDPQEEEDQETR